MVNRELCFQFAHKLYLDSEDGVGTANNLWRVGESLDIERKLSQEIADQLKNEGLLDYLSFEGDVVLTSFGTAAVMQALADGDQATVYFPPVSQLIVEPPQPTDAITTESVNNFIDGLTEKAESMLLEEHEKLELEEGILLLEKYVDSGAANPAELCLGLEKVCTLLSADSDPQ